MPEIEEAQEILEAFGMPRAQHNIRSLDTEEKMAAIVRDMNQKRLWYADLIA